MPRRMSQHAAGFDLSACLPGGGSLSLRPGQRVLVPTGLAVAIPVGYEGQVRPRSGLALHHGIVVANSPGTIDADYRGELKIILLNLGDEAFEFVSGERVAQLVVVPVATIEAVEVEELLPADRGGGGFGSTGR